MLVSVLIPTYHRPQDLARAVASVLHQDLSDRQELEVVIAVSDAKATEDVATATALAGDERVRFVTAAGPGPAAARNAAMETARGEVLAFIDDDCEAQPGWLANGLAAMAHADIVQGSTRPAEPPSTYGHTISVDPPSWLWETCNLFVRRSAATAVGDFDEAWNPTGTPGNHWGEDTIWAWDVVRRGARMGFARDAVVHHAVQEQDMVGWIRQLAKQRYFASMLRRAPEARRRLYLRYFLSRRHVTLTAVAGTLLLAATARAVGQQRLARTMVALAVTGYMGPYIRPAGRDLLRHRLPKDLTEFAVALYATVRYRRVIL
jgi:glycosyltransferase involved in cell wall biosynthesis